MFCPNCGTKNDDAAVFCVNCGTPLMQEQPQETQANAPVQPQQNVEQQMQFGSQPQFAQQAAPKKQFKVTKKMIAIGAAVAAILVAVIVFVGVGKTGSDYKKTAKKYAQAVLKCDWDTAYDMVNLPESEFLTKEAFKSVNKETTPKTPSAIVVTEIPNYPYEGSTPQVGKDVTVTYSTPGASQSYMNLYMDVSPKKYMLFFKQYKVSSDTLVSSDIKIRVPAGSKLFVNDVEVNGSYKVENTSSGSYSKTQDVYKIPFLFDGANSIKVTGDLFEDYETTFNVSFDEDVYTVSSSDFKMKQEILNALKSQAEADLKMISASCLQNKDVSALNGRIYSEALNNVTRCYGYSLQDCHTSSKDVKTLELSNIKTNIRSENLTYDSDDGYPVAQVTLGYSKTGTYVYNSSSDKVRDGKGTETSDYIRYKYVDGNWMMYYFSIDLYIS